MELTIISSEIYEDTNNDSDTCCNVVREISNQMTNIQQD